MTGSKYHTLGWRVAVISLIPAVVFGPVSIGTIEPFYSLELESIRFHQ